MGLYDRILIFDTETGGLDEDRNAILEIAGYVWQRVPGGPGKVLGSFRYAVDDPDGICDPEALAINGIDMATHNGTPAYVVVAMMESFIRDVYFNGEDVNDRKVVLGGHNVSTFDIGFLRRLYRIAGYETKGRESHFERVFSHRVVDTCSIVRFLVLAGVLPLEGAGSKEAFEYFGIYPDKAHTALADADATMKLLDKMVELMLPITFVTNATS